MKQIVNRVDIAVMEERITQLEPEIVEHLYSFGTVLFSEVQQRAAHLDAKLTSFLGWSSAMLVFFLLDHTTDQGYMVGAVTSIAGAFALASMLTAFIALKSSIVAVPGEQDWFKETLFNDARGLRRFHTISLLTSHQSQSDDLKKKADWLRRSEWCLFASAFISGLLLLSRKLFLFL